jgi:hypothetical protein
MRYKYNYVELYVLTCWKKPPIGDTSYGRSHPLVTLPMEEVTHW